MKVLLKFALLILGVFLGIAAIIVWWSSYESTVLSILTYTGKLHKIEDFKASYLTLGKYRLIRLVLSSLTIVYILLVFLIWKRIGRYADRITIGLERILEVIHGIVHSLKSLARITKFILAVFNIGFLIFVGLRILNTPISYDEAWTFLNFSSKNPFISLSYYPAPNNHVFFSLLTNITTFLPIDPKVALRVISLVCGLLTINLFFLLIKEFFDEKIALIATSFFLASYPVLLYSSQARGYILLIFFTVASLFALLKIVFGDNRKTYWFIFITASVFGFYTIPTFLYPFLSFTLFALCQLVNPFNLTKLRSLFICSLIVGCLTLLLYLPVIIVSGMNALTSNPYVQRREFSYVWDHLKDHLQQTCSWLITAGNSSYLIFIGLILLLLGIMLVLKGTQTASFALLCFFSLLLPIAFMLLQRVIPFERTWAYLVVIIGIGVAVITDVFFQLLKQRISTASTQLIIYGISLFIVVTNIIRFNALYFREFNRDYRGEVLANKILLTNANKIFIDYDYYDVLLEYNFKVSQKPYVVERRNIAPLNSYDCIITSNTQVTAQVTSNDREIYQDNIVRAYIIAKDFNQ